jgi:predicted amidohydrolase
MGALSRFKINPTRRTRRNRESLIQRGGTLTIGVQLCREIVVPEQWRHLADAGAQVFAYLTHAANPGRARRGLAQSPDQPRSSKTSGSSSRRMPLTLISTAPA